MIIILGVPDASSFYYNHDEAFLFVFIFFVFVNVASSSSMRAGPLTSN